MAWGRTKIPPPPPPPKSTLASLLPLIILLLLVSGFAFIAYQIWLVVNNIGDATTKKMETKNIVLTKDGVKVGVKEVGNEEYVDRTQGVLMKAWSMSSWPGYKSKIWNVDNGGDTARAEKEQKKRR